MSKFFLLTCPKDKVFDEHCTIETVDGMGYAENLIFNSFNEAKKEAEETLNLRFYNYKILEIPSA